MAKQTIGVGLAANDGGGDPLRSAFVKVNENFTELYNSTATIPTTLLNLGITDGTNGQVLTTDGNGAFTFTTVSGGGSTLGALTDVSSVAATTGQVLKWDGTQWAPGTDAGGGGGIALTDLSVAAEPAAAGDGALAYDSGTGAFTYTPPVIPADLNDLGISDGTNGQVLTTDGAGGYTFEDASGGGGSAITIQDEGSALPTAATTINFVGTGVTASGTGATKTITIAGGGSSLQTRTTKAATASSLANEATANLTISGFKGYALYSIETSHAAWVRLYIDTTARSSDSSRTINTDPAPDAGVIAEVITTSGQKVDFGPAVIGYCSTGTDIYATVTNKSGGTENVAVTLTVLQLES